MSECSSAAAAISVNFEGLELNKSLIFFKFFRNEEARDDGFKLGAIYPSMERSHGSARAFLAVLRLGFTHLTPVSLIPHHLASLWKSSVGAVVFALLRAGS